MVPGSRRTIGATNLVITSSGREREGLSERRRRTYLVMSSDDSPGTSEISLPINSGPKWWSDGEIRDGEISEEESGQPNERDFE